MLDFYSDERAKLLYKHGLCQLATRASSITGVRRAAAAACSAPLRAACTAGAGRLLPWLRACAPASEGPSS